MDEYLFLFHSLTKTYLAQKMLVSKGVKASVVNTPLNYTSEGCGYSVKVLKQDAEKAEMYLRRANMVYQKILHSPEKALRW